MSHDLELIQGAKNAVQVAMKVEPSDRVFILTDQETLDVAQALEDEIKTVGATVVSVCLEESGARPITRFPEELAQCITSFSPTVTFYAASVKENELALRTGLIALVLGQLGARHAHMPTITAQIMREGMRLDYNQVSELTLRVYEIVRHAKTIHVTSPDGTDILARFDEKLRWLPMNGLYHKPRSFGNLPEGEVCTSPAFIEGRFVAYVLGDYLSAKYSVLPQPVTFEIVASHAEKIECERQDIADEVADYLDSVENGRRVGEFAIGTNTGIARLCGFILQDEKIPGVHIAFGDPLGHQTGADWTSAIHVDVVNPGCTIEVDGETLMKDGRFILK
ncbi:MAG: aminopeptidase [Chloroflexota bacterium]